MKYCLCDCGILINEIDKKGRKRSWVRGHSATRLKLPNIDKDTLIDLYWNKNLSTVQIGKMFNMNNSAIIKRLRKYNISIKNHSQYRKGCKHSLETKQKMSKAHLGKKPSQETIEKLSKYRRTNWIGKNNPFYGKKHSKETIEKMRLIKIGKFSGEKHPLWKGGTSKLPYAFNFNEELKELVRKRDGYKCRLCQAPQEEYSKRLPIHHIDFNKQNSSSDNLITLCPICHNKTIHKQEKYMFLKELI